MSPIPRKNILGALLRRYIESQVYQAVVENIACEQSARMVAMKSATENAGDIIKELQLIYNKARQASITQELLRLWVAQKPLVDFLVRGNDYDNKRYGSITEIIGAVVDIEFPRGCVPKVYDALRIEETNLTLEVQQQLGDGVVRAIAMGATEGLKRGLTAKNTGEPIKVPVGEKTFVRIMNVLGDPIDQAGEIGETCQCRFVKRRTLLTKRAVLNYSKRV